jgi:hypothetical protein
MNLEGDWADLQTRGFVVLRNFLPPELLEAAQKEAQASRPVGYETDIWLMSQDTKVQVQALMRAAMTAVGEKTDIKLTDFDGYGFYFHPNQKCKFVWHTDLPSYFMFQNHYDYVNFWVPIQKPARDRTGLELLPMDTLKKLNPKAYEVAYRRGACALVPADVAERSGSDIWKWWITSVGYFKKEEGDVLLAEVDGRTERIPLGFKLSDHTVAPEMAPGDALVVRGDVLHNGQDLDTDRVALSVRAVNGEQMSRKEFFLGVSSLGRSFLSGGSPVAEQVLAAYSYYGKDEIPVKDLLEFLTALQRGEPAQLKACEDIRPRVSELVGAP